jgi:hypothetical protein
MSAGEPTFEVPPGLPDIITLGKLLWGDPTNRNPDEVRFGSHGSKIVKPAPQNVWCDHEAGVGGGYIDLYRLKYGELPTHSGFSAPPGMANELGEPTAWWDYQDSNGATIARVVRFDPPGQQKTYRQCRPDGERWKWKMEGLQMPLYHLPEILTAQAGSAVYITEGEKHADLLRAWGLIATTNAGGAKKFRADHAAMLSGFECIILPDNDDAGRAHRDVVAKALRSAGCSSIRVVDLPDLPPKGDIIDWVKAGGTAAAFEGLVAKASLAEAPVAVTLSEQPDSDHGVDALIAEFNDQYLVVNEGGKALIFQPAYDPVLKRRRFDRLSPRDLYTLHMNRQIRVGTDDKKNPIYKPVADVWMRHPGRRQFIRGVIFDPTMQAGPGVLNLWEGFAVKPARGDWSLLRDHIRLNVCGGNKAHYDYLMGWMARMFQHPDQQGEVAVVLKGGEGIGKGTLARVLRHIVGHHSLAISDAKHLVGSFNAHLGDVIFLFADEAFFAGDRAHVGVLKSLITEPSLTIEAKYSNAKEVPNYLHIMMASNEEWVVPAAMDARRFFVLEVAETVKNDTVYFAAIWKQMEAGGYEAMLHDLLQYDITSFNVRTVPLTEGLQQQKKLSLPVPEAWWMDVLHRGYVFRSKLGLEEFFHEWHNEVTTELLFASYSEYSHRARDRHPMSREAFGRFMKDLGCRPSRPTNAVIGEHIADVMLVDGGTQRRAVVARQPRPPAYNIGSLSEARHAFSASTNLSVDWDDHDAEP